MAEKKVRSPNFLPAEKESLLKIVTKYKGVIENKETDAVNSKIKNNCWEKIAIEFNCTEGRVHRDAKSLKSLWENLKRSTRKHFAEVKKQVHLTVPSLQHLVIFFHIRGGHVNISASGRNANIFEHVKPLIEASVTGLPNPFDNDYIPALDDAAYAQLAQNRKSVETFEGSGEDEEMQLEAWQNVEDVPPQPPTSSHSENTYLHLTEGGAGPSTHHHAEVGKVLSQKDMTSILNKGRTAKNRQTRMRNAERAQIFVDLATSKKELVELMKNETAGED